MGTENEFWERLARSGKKLIVFEAGLGVPIQSVLLSYDGVSKTLLRGSVPYHDGAKQGLEPGIRSVSEDYVFNEAFEEARRVRHSGSLRRAFGLSDETVYIYVVSGAYYPERRSHAWAGLLEVDRYGGMRSHTMHFWMPPHPASRQSLFYNTLPAHEWFLKPLMFDEPWITPDYPLPPPVIDVVNSPTIPMNLQLELARSGAYGGGGAMCAFDPGNIGGKFYHKMVRPEDVLRGGVRVVRGSFNPIHNAHLQLAGPKGIFEINWSNLIKGAIDVEDMAHRVNMILALGRRVIVTAIPTFVEFQDQLTRMGATDIEYGVGEDVMKKIMDPQYFARTDKLEVISKKNKVRFIVQPRESSLQWDTASVQDILAGAKQYDLDVKLEEPGPENRGCSSSAIRETKDFSRVPEAAREYIKEHGLYV